MLGLKDSVTTKLNASVGLSLYAAVHIINFHSLCTIMKYRLTSILLVQWSCNSVACVLNFFFFSFFFHTLFQATPYSSIYASILKVFIIPYQYFELAVHCNSGVSPLVLFSVIYSPLWPSLRVLSVKIGKIYQSVKSENFTDNCTERGVCACLHTNIVKFLLLGLFTHLKVFFPTVLANKFCFLGLHVYKV